MKVSVDLAKLSLRGRSGRRMVAPKVRAEDVASAIGVLREAGLDDARIATLRGRLEVEHTLMTADEPTAGDDRKVIEAAAALADALAQVLAGASKNAYAEMKAAYSLDYPRAAQVDLSRFARGLWQRAEGMPQQGRRRPHRVGIVAALNDVAGDVLPKPTTAPDSRFYEAATAAFTLAGKPGSPDQAIRAFMKGR